MDLRLKTIIVEASSLKNYAKLLQSARAKKNFSTKRITRGVSFAVTGASSRIDKWLAAGSNPRRVSARNTPRALFKPRLLYASASASPASSITEGRMTAFAEPRVVSPVFTCKEYASIYNFPPPPAPGSGPLVVISVISFGGGLFGTATANQSDGLVYITDGDVQAHWHGLGMTAGTSMPRVAIKLQPGASNNPSGDIGSTGENTLDVEMIGACYPSSDLLIVLFIAPNTFSAFVDVVAAASRPIRVAGAPSPVLPSAVSVSWGAPETAFGSAMATRISNVIQAAARSGVNTCCATGDNGATDGTGSLCCDFPSSSPYAVACGGTSLVCPTRVRADVTTAETVWTGTGGGKSRIFAKPPHQYALSGQSRQTPDVAMNADPNTGVWFTINGSAVQLGGTSIVAPAFAAWTALTRTRAFVSPMLYASPNAAYYDIVAGSNGGYRAGAGFDNCSGLGSINGSALAAAVQSNVAVSSIRVQATAAAIAVAPTRVTVAVTVSAAVLPSNASSTALSWATSSNAAVSSISSIPASPASITLAVVTITTTTASSSTNFAVTATDALTSAVSGSLAVRKTTSRTTLSLSAVAGRDLKSLLPSLSGIVGYLALRSTSPSILLVSSPDFGLRLSSGARRGSVATVTAAGLSAQGAVIIATVSVTLSR